MWERRTALVILAVWNTYWPVPVAEETVYEPQPIDTTGIELPQELLALRELLARNSHDIWAQQRIADGWTYGPERDDVKKEHPDLVPYPDLPESEKDYDRNVSVQTLKVIVALGFRMVKD